MSRTADLETQVSFLRWSRLQKDSAIKHAVEHSHNLKDRDTTLQLITSQGTDRIIWRRSVIADELTKPLVLTDAEALSIQEADEKRERHFISVS